jgi:hypothetical protein
VVTKTEGKASAARRSPGWAALLVLPAAFAVWWIFGTLDLQRAPSWNVLVKQPEAAGEIELYVTKNELDPRYHADDPLSESVRVDATENGLRVTVPAEVRVTRSEWLLRAGFSGWAVRESVRDLSVSVNGKVIEEDLSAKEKLRLSVAFADLGPGDNTFELTAPVPGVFRRVRIRNHVTFHGRYPTLSVLRVRGPYLRGARSLLGMAGALAIGGGLLFALSWLVTRRLRVPVWTLRQWSWTVAPVVAIAAGLCVRNLISPDKVLFGQWSMASLVLIYLLVAGVWCCWRNLRAERWDELDQATRARFLEARHAVVLFLVIWLVYNSNSARVGMIDGIPPPQMAISLLRQGNMNLDEYLHTYKKVDRGVGLMQANEHWVSRWPPGTALFCIPFYALPVALGVEVPSLGVDMLAKLTASTLTAASAIFVFLCLRRFASRRGATWMTIAYALGTAAFHISAQDTWAHGPTQFCLAAVLSIAVAEPRRRVWHLLAGFLIGLMVAARPQSLVLALPLLVWIAYRNGILIWAWYALGGLLPALFLAGYSVQYFGTPGFEGYEEIIGGGWNLVGLPKALLGLLVSPNRGMLIFSPFLLFCIYGAGVGLRQEEHRYRMLALALVVGLMSYLLLTASWRAWHAIFSYGSRYSADTLPYWALCGGFVIDRIRSRPLWRTVFATTIVLSILIHSLAVYWDIHPWNHMVQRERHLKVRNFEDAAWITDDPQILWQARFALDLLDED